MFLNSLKNAALIKQEFVCFKHTPFIESVCLSLYKEGLIQSYFIEKININECIIVYIRYYYNKSSLSDIKILLKKKKNNNLKLKNIINFTSKKKLFFISTKFGILNSFDCKQKKIGGITMFSC
jgi:ribosomal protein S8